MKEISDDLMTKLIKGIKVNIDYSGLCRKTLIVDPLPKGALPVYDKIGAAVLSIGKKGNATLSDDECTKLQVPIFNIEEEIKDINGIDEITEENLFKFINDLYKKIIQTEDNMLISMLETTANNYNNLIKLNNGFTLHEFKNSFIQFSKKLLIVDKIIINTNTFNIMRNWETEELDLITKIEILSTGLFAYIYNADVYINKNVPDNVVYLIAAPEFTGVMPIKTDINQKDNLVSEEVGMAIVNTNSILKIEF